MLESVAVRHILLAYLGAVNISAFAAFAVDKGKAIRDEWRIPEATLWALSAVGGATGSLLGMYTCHHKTRKPEFKYGMPLLCAAQVALVYLLYK